MLKQNRSIHFVGIGGVGMSGIAELLLNLGYKVSGSDISKTDITDRLSKLGAKIYIGHSAANVKEVDVVVTSSAIPKENIEVRTAKENRIPIIPRADMLQELMRLKEGIAVSGAHGKTTTTSIISLVLSKAGLDPTIVIGGRFQNIRSHARLGNGRYLVAEADESDGSFLKLRPFISVVTNIDLEHLDYYKDLKKIKEAFLSFINSVPFYGCSVLCLDCENIRELIGKIRRRFITYGRSQDATIRAEEIVLGGLCSEFSVFYRNRRLGKVRINLPGVHYVSNSLAAIAVGLELGIPFQDIAASLLEFQSVDRRYHVKGNIKNILIIDDYAHHPTEIKATLQSARIGWNRRIIAVFQPHRYTRTGYLKKEFGRCFFEASRVVVTKIYPAGEKPIKGVSSKSIVDSLKEANHPDVKYIEDFTDIVNYLLSSIKEGDLVITLGAGDIWKVADKLVEALKKDDCKP
ncbi:MAG: UDP-N-acetylmuramate--L-alanine ligase [bacterium]|nr:UDP-N-acetylmuramate--L-alanine ligase [bacterium]